MILDQYPIKYIHRKRNQSEGCDGVAFYIKDKEFKIGDVLCAQDVICESGLNPKPRTPFKCMSCNTIFERILIENLEYN